MFQQSKGEPGLVGGRVRSAKLRLRRRSLRPEVSRAALEERVMLSGTDSSMIALPLYFEANEGQLVSSVQFVSRGTGYQLSLAGSDAVLSLQNGESAAIDRVAMSLMGGRVPTATRGVDELPGKVNYFIGTDPSQWRTMISTYAKVQLDNVYPGVDLVYYGNQGSLEYDFIVAPGIDPRQITMRYDGVTGAQLDTSGNLVLSAPGGNLVMHKPILYQMINGLRKDVSGAFELRGPGQVGFVVGTYDANRPLVIDPILQYATYFGGSGNDQALAVAVDNQGAAYFTGSTLSVDLATTAGSLAPTSFISEVFKTTNSTSSWNGAGAGLPDASFSVLVVDPTNPNIVYGGTDNNNNSLSPQGLFKSSNGGVSWIAINNGLPSGNSVSSLVIDPQQPSTLYVTLSGGFLFKTTDGGANWSNSATGIASSESSAGLGALAISASNPQVLYVMASRNWLYKTTNGGASWARIHNFNPGTPSEIDQLPFTQKLIVDPTDPNIIYAAVTKGVFFSTPGDVYKSTNGGTTFTRTGITTTSQFSIVDMVMDPADRQTLYVAVLQFSSVALYRTTNGGGSWTSLTASSGANDLAMAATPGGSTLYMSVFGQGILKSTNQGASFSNANLAVRNVTQIGVSASAPGTLYAATPGRPRDSSNNIATDAFVAKVNPAGTAYEYITYLGGPAVDVGLGIAVDASHNAYITGKTIANSFPTTPGAFQATSPSTTQRLNAFVTKLNPTGSSLVYSTYLAGISGGFSDVEDHGRAIAVDSQGRAAVTGVASSSNFPSTPSGFDPSGPGFGSFKAFVTLLKADGSGLDYGTFLGGGGDEDLGNAIAFDAQGNIHVAGETGNGDPFGNGPTNFPTTASAFQSASGIPRRPAAFYAKINPNLQGAASLLYSTVFFGAHPSDSNTADTTRAMGVAVDGLGRAFVVGRSLTPTLPMRNGFDTTYGGDDTSSFANPLGDGFLAVFDPSLSGDASLIYSTFLGGSKADAAYAVAVEGNGRAVVTGVSNSPDFVATSNFLNLGATSTAFITRVNINASGGASLVESYLYGGRSPSASEGHGLAVDNNGNIYLVGFTNSIDLQLNNPAQGGLRGGTDAFIAKLTPSSSTTDLSVSITASPDPVNQNDNLTFTITVTNNGPSAVTGAFLSDMLDTNDVFISATPAATSVSGRIVNFAIGALAVGQSRQFQVVARVGAPLDPQVNINNNTAIVRADRPDSVPGNNTFTAGTLIHVKTADIAMQPSVVGGAILQGQNFLYELKVFNNGPDAATGVKVQATLPSNAIFVSSSPAATSVNGAVRTFDLPDIPSGSSKSVFITMTPLGTAGDFIQVSATTVANEFETNAANNSATLTKVVSTPDQADLAVSLVGPPNGITGIGDITYTATVVNNGPHEANNVILTADATALFPITSITPSQGTASQSNNIIIARLGRLASGASATVSFVIHIDTDAQVTVHASVKADESDPDPNNDSTKNRVKVRNGSLVFVVTNTNDSGPGSLRQAILDSEDAQSTVEFPNHIVFSIPETDPGKNSTTGAFIFQPKSKLPALFNPVVIDGYTQPGASANTNPIDLADNAHIRIELDGSQEGLPNNGFDIYARNCVIRGLAINSFITKLQRGTAVNLLLNGFGININASFTTIEGCFLGTDASGTVAKANEVTGIAVFGSNNTIGGTTAAARNVISGNGALAVAIATGVAGNVVIGNFVGTDITGAKALPTNLLTVAGLRLASSGVSPQGLNNTIGGTTPEARNVISGNNGAGVYFAIPQGSSSGSASNSNVVIGNYIGTDLTGTKAVPNNGDGIFNQAGVNNTIGGTTAAERNIISGNSYYGVEFNDAANVVRGNFIGTDVTGTKALGNRLAGVYANGAGGTVGGSAAGAGNVISGNNGPGVQVAYDSYLVQGNSIGLDANGNPLGNAGDGVWIAQLTTATVGAAKGQGNSVVGNTVAFNLGSGVAVTAIDSSLGGGTGNAILNNSIFGNKKLGIDLASDGVTANHAALTSAPGPNHLQNYPVLTSATFGATQTTVQGTLAGLANRDYTVQFFTSTFVDPSNFGEGEMFLGQGTAHTDATGNVTFSIPINSSDIRGLWVTATATTGNPQVNAFGSDTSEFSAAVLVTGISPATPSNVSANLSIVAQVLTANPQVGRDLVYRFTVTNNGPDTAHTVVFSHELPVTLQDASVNSSVGAAILNAGSIIANLGTLQNGASATITVTATPISAGPLSGSASVDLFETDPVTSNNTATFQTTVATGSLDTDLAVSMVLLTPGPFRLGDLFTYKITVSNNGPRVATNVSLADTLPAGAIFDAFNSSAGWTGTTTRTISLGALAPGDSISVFLAIQSTVAGAISSAATVSLFQPDSDTSNNTAILVTTVLRSPSVTVLTDSPRTSDPNQNVTFSVSVVSPTIGTPQGHVVFKEGNTVVDERDLDSAGAANFSKSNLSAGVHTIIADYQGNASFAPSSTTLNHTVTGASQSSADLSLVAEASPNPVFVGQNLTYTFTVTNNGPSAATNVVISHTLPSGTTFSSNSATAGGNAVRNGNQVTATFASLAADATGKLTVVVTPTSAGSLALAASVSGAESDPNSLNNAASTSVTVNVPNAPAADLSVSIGANTTSVLQGTNVTFTVTAGNAGPDTAANATITVTLPAGMTFVSSTQGTHSNGVVTIPLGDMNNGTTANVTIIATATGTGSLLVAACIAATSPQDLNSANNSASVTVTSAAPSANLSVLVEADQTTVLQDSNVNFEISAFNSGPQSAQNVTLVVTLPPGLAFVSTSLGSVQNGVITVSLGDVPDGPNALVVSIVAQAIALGQLPVIANVSAESPSDPSPLNNTAGLTITSNPPNADVAVTLTPSRIAVAQGSQFTYTATVRNTGPLAAEDVKLTVTLPEGVTFVSASLGTHDAGVVRVPVGALGVGASVEVAIVVEATNPGSLQASAQVTSPTPVDLNSNNDSAIAMVTSNAPITLSQTVQIVYGSVTVPSYSGYGNPDVVVVGYPLSTAVYDAIVASAGLDPRVISALTSLRDASPANPTNLNFFTGVVTINPNASVFGGLVRKPIPSETASFESQVNDYLQLVTAGAGSVSYIDSAVILPLTFSFPDLTTADTGQVRNGELTVNVILRDANISGPIGTSIALAALNNPAVPRQDATFEATIFGNGKVGPAVGELITFSQGEHVLGSAPIAANGKARFTTNALEPGVHTITASYAGSDEFAQSGSNPVAQTIGDLSGPRVEIVDRLGIHMQSTFFVITFSEALDAATAQNLGNYRIVARGRDGKFGTRDDVIIRVVSATYGVNSHTVRLALARRLPLSRQFRLVVRGSTPGGIQDETGTRLDGQADSRNGTDYVTLVSRANLVIPEASTRKKTTNSAAATLTPSLAAVDKGDQAPKPAKGRNKRRDR